MFLERILRKAKNVFHFFKSFEMVLLFSGHPGLGGLKCDTVLTGVTIKRTCLRGRVTVRRRADEINFGRGVSTTDVYDEAADRN